MGPVQIILTVVLLAGLIFIYKRSNESEDLLGLKLFGYYFLGSFRFNFNEIAIPLGFLIYLIAFHPHVNAKSKRQAAVLGLFIFLTGVAQPAIEKYLFEMPIEVKTEIAGLYDADLAKDWQAIKQQLELPDDTRLEDFYAAFEEDGSIRELRYKLICQKDGGLLYCDVNLASKQEVYIIRRSKLDQWLQYGRLVTASRFFDIVSGLNVQDLKPKKEYAWYCLASEGQVITYDIKGRAIFAVDDKGGVLPLNKENLPVTGYYLSIYGMHKLDETSYQGEGYQDYFFDIVPAAEKSYTVSQDFPPYTTAVIKETHGKQGPGADYPDTVHLSYGRLISLIGNSEGSKEWLLATFVPEMDDMGGVPEPQAEAEKKFWVRYDTIEPRTQNTISFNEPFQVMNIQDYHYVAIGDPANEGRLFLRQMPDEYSPYAALTRDGNLLSVVQKDNEWSLVKKFNGSTMTEYTQIGWIKNDSYKEYQPGMKVTQGFVLRSTPMYEQPDSSSKQYPPQNLQNTVLPVNILKSENDWTYISSGFNGLALWVRSSAVKYTFTQDELFKLAYPEIDKNKFLQAMKKDLQSWPGIELRQDDVNTKIILTAGQKAALAEKLTDIKDVFLFDGNVAAQREAVYPFYWLDLLLNGTSDFPQNSSYGFVVGEDKLMVLIPYNKLKDYGLNPDNIAVRFIQVNKEFIDYLTGLLPAPANNNPQDLNYLFNANKVLVQDNTGWIGDQTGIIYQQVNKCVRLIKSYAGQELKGSSISNDLKANIDFTFTFADGSEKMVKFTDQYLEYDGKTYALTGYNGNPQEILTALFVAYF